MESLPEKLLRLILEQKPTIIVFNPKTINDQLQLILGLPKNILNSLLDLDIYTDLTCPEYSFELLNKVPLTATKVIEEDIWKEDKKLN